jgi:type IV fimbrial biogenesis protein FimT
MPGQHLPHPRGLTLVEVLVVIALVGILIALAAPSMRDLIAAKRVQGITNELVTDMQYARSEAARRSRDVRIGFQATDQLSCYALYIEPEVAPGALPASGVNGGTGTCDCRRTPGVSVCSAEVGREEIKTVQVPRSLGVSFNASSTDGPTLNFGGDFGRLKSASVPGGLLPDGFEFDVSVTATPRGQLRTSVSTSGRPGVCSPDGSISATPRC